MAESIATVISVIMLVVIVIFAVAFPADDAGGDQSNF